MPLGNFIKVFLISFGNIYENKYNQINTFTQNDLFRGDAWFFDGFNCVVGVAVIKFWNVVLIFQIKYEGDVILFGQI